MKLALFAALAFCLCGVAHAQNNVQDRGGTLQPAPPVRAPLEPRPPNVNPDQDAIAANPDGGRAAELEALPNDMRPGRHTITLGVAMTGWSRAQRVHDWGCNASINGMDTDAIGWGQMEDSNPLVWAPACSALLLQRTITFDTARLDAIPVKTIERAVLAYDETELGDCGALYRQGIPTGQYQPCWTNGDGAPEQKPQGCIEVRVPAGDWRTPAAQGLREVAEPETETIRRLAPNSWDVSTAFAWQYVSMPLGGARRYGFLLTGWPRSLDQLTADDSTMCVSRITNVRLEVTYTIPQGGGREQIN